MLLLFSSLSAPEDMAAMREAKSKRICETGDGKDVQHYCKISKRSAVFRSIRSPELQFMLRFNLERATGENRLLRRRLSVGFCRGNQSHMITYSTDQVMQQAFATSEMALNNRLVKKTYQAPLSAPSLDASSLSQIFMP